MVSCASHCRFLTWNPNSLGIDWSDVGNRNRFTAHGRARPSWSETLRALGTRLVGPERNGAPDRHSNRGRCGNTGGLCRPDKARRRRWTQRPEGCLL